MRTRFGFTLALVFLWHSLQWLDVRMRVIRRGTARTGARARSPRSEYPARKAGTRAHSAAATRVARASPQRQGERLAAHEQRSPVRARPAKRQRFHLDPRLIMVILNISGPPIATVLRIDRDHHRLFPTVFTPWDWSVCTDCCWDCGDDFVVYEDPDHPGWHLLYNVHTGHYVHVTYLGA
jgi:hypothetical protein